METKHLIGFLENEKACYKHKVPYGEIKRGEYLRQIVARLEDLDKLKSGK